MKTPPPKIDLKGPDKNKPNREFNFRPCRTDFSQDAAETGDVVVRLAARLQEPLAPIHVAEGTRYELMSKEVLTGLREFLEGMISGDSTTERLCFAPRASSEP